MEMERGGLLVTRWLTESSAYQPWQSIMVSHLYAELKINHLVTGMTWPTESEIDENVVKIELICCHIW